MDNASLQLSHAISKKFLRQQKYQQLVLEVTNPNSPLPEWRRKAILEKEQKRQQQELTRLKKQQDVLQKQMQEQQRRRETMLSESNTHQVKTSVELLKEEYHMDKYVAPKQLPKVDAVTFIAASLDNIDSIFIPRSAHPINVFDVFDHPTQFDSVLQESLGKKTSLGFNPLAPKSKDQALTWFQSRAPECTLAPEPNKADQHYICYIGDQRAHWTAHLEPMTSGRRTYTEHNSMAWSLRKTNSHHQVDSWWEDAYSYSSLVGANTCTRNDRGIIVLRAQGTHPTKHYKRTVDIIAHC